MPTKQKNTFFQGLMKYRYTSEILQIQVQTTTMKQIFPKASHMNFGGVLNVCKSYVYTII